MPWDLSNAVKPHSSSKTWQEYSSWSLAFLFLLHFPALTPFLLVLETLIDICEYTTETNTKIPRVLEELQRTHKVAKMGNVVQFHPPGANYSKNKNAAPTQGWCWRHSHHSHSSSVPLSNPPPSLSHQNRL